MKLLVPLHGKHHADKHSGNQYDADAANADFVHALQHDRSARQTSRHPAQRGQREQRKITQPLNEADRFSAQRVNQVSGISRRSGRHSVPAMKMRKLRGEIYSRRRNQGETNPGDAETAESGHSTSLRADERRVMIRPNQVVP